MTQALLPPVFPRERILRLGGASLTDQELWQCILGVGSAARPVREMSSHLSKLFTTWMPGDDRLPHLPSWLGPAQRARVLAILELSQRWRSQKSVSLSSPQQVLMWCQSLRMARNEQILVLYCGVNGDVLRQETVAMGSLNQVGVTPKEIFRLVGDLPVDSLVLCHNHPSGSLMPSSEDEVFTARIEAACKLLGFWLRDHLIVTKTGYYSFRESGKLTHFP